MKFIQIPANTSVFIDANIFIYYFTPDPIFGPECQVLMEQISKYQDFSAFTSTHVLGEVMHQLMIVEASKLPGWGLGKIKKHRPSIRNLSSPADRAGTGCARRAASRLCRLP